jgi:hypothetical protein
MRIFPKSKYFLVETVDLLKSVRHSSFEGVLVQFNIEGEIDPHPRVIVEV